MFTIYSQYNINLYSFFAQAKGYLVEGKLVCSSNRLHLIDSFHVGSDIKFMNLPSALCVLGILLLILEIQNHCCAGIKSQCLDIRFPSIS